MTIFLFPFLLLEATVWLWSSQYSVSRTLSCEISRESLSSTWKGIITTGRAVLSLLSLPPSSYVSRRETWRCNSQWHEGTSMRKKTPKAKEGRAKTFGPCQHFSAAVPVLDCSALDFSLCEGKKKTAFCSPTITCCRQVVCCCSVAKLLVTKRTF